MSQGLDRLNANVTATISRLMVEELELDLANSTVYRPKTIEESDFDSYVQLLRRNFESGDLGALVVQLSHIISAKASDAAFKLAEGQFGRYYMRAVCREAIVDNRMVSAIRARDSVEKRIESEMLIGRPLDPNVALKELRDVEFYKQPLGLCKANSGLLLEAIE